ncbi:MAG TPA: hypothetical protein VFQ92_06210, partial [Blastocatellia bacterium]|nr:hypothetical protein [Blastocatellia bacterium]
MTTSRLSAVFLMAVFVTGIAVSQAAQQPAPAPQEPPRPLSGPPGYMAAAEAALAQPFKGITTDGNLVPGLFSIRRTGVSTKPIKDAADALIASLNP